MPRPQSSTVKRRLEVGDLVTLKVSYGIGIIVGRVATVTDMPKDQVAMYGLYQYGIVWYDTAENIATQNGWSISDMKNGRLKYLKDLSVLKVLYGKV